MVLIKKQFFLFLFFLFLGPSLLIAQIGGAKFERITGSSGLSLSTVRAILQDQTGFLWFGTDDGLNRYDGYSFKIYKRQPHDSNSLSHNMIWCLLEDRNGVLWIGTEMGLNSLDPKTERFHRYLNEAGQSDSLSHNSVRSLCEDPNGDIWVGTNNGLNRLNRKTGKFEQYHTSSADKNSLSDSRIRSLCVDSEGRLWVGTFHGLTKFDREKNSFVRFYPNPGDFPEQSRNRVRSMIQDRKGLLWIATNNGLHAFDPTTETFIPPASIIGDSYSLCGESIRALLIDKAGDLWVGTINGLSCYDHKIGAVRCYQFDAQDPYSISSNQIRSIYQDRGGIVWIGTYMGWLNKFDPKRTKFVHYHKDNIYPARINHNEVRAFYEDDHGKIWIGTNGGGLNVFDREKRDYSYYLPVADDPSSLSSDRVYAIYGDRAGSIWVGTNGGGLEKVIFSLSLQKKIAGFKNYRHNPKDPSSLSSDRVRCIIEDYAGFLWIGTFDNGVNRFDPRTETFTAYTHDPQNPQSLSNDTIQAIYEDSQKILWVATRKGLNRFHPEDGSFTVYRTDLEDETRLSDHSVLSMHEDGSGVLWVGTHNGLNKFDRDKEIFFHYHEEDGLPNDVVYGILEDTQGNLWLSTNKGVAKFDPKTGTCKSYDTKDGLQGEEFAVGAFYKSPGGEMFFGGNQGFNAFYPEKIIENPHIPPIVITDFQLFNVSIGMHADHRWPLERTITYSESIKLGHRENSISFEFVALDFSAPEKNQYAYILEGFETEWNYPQHRRFATYTNLPPGKYVLRVKGTNDSGVWNEEGAVLHVTVVPPFWKRMGFQIFMVFFILGSVLLGYKLRIAAMKRQQKKLEEQVAERTEELKETQAQLIQSAKMASLGDLVAGIVHEFNSPMGALNSSTDVSMRGLNKILDRLKGSGTLEELQNEKEMQKAVSVLHDNLQTSSDARERLDTLITRLKQFARMDSLTMQACDINRGIESTLSVLRQEMEDRIRVVRKFGELPEIKCYPGELNQVFLNLIRNAVQAIEGEGTITIRTWSSGTHVYIEIEDTGCGIEFEKLTDLFELKFTRSQSRVKLGLGLAISYQVVSRHNGEILVQSEPGKGSKFTVILPIDLQNEQSSSH
ncbi:MAG: two-component regulator propeller domain-containing protein [Candidatus Aminicenantes bacterium]|jgi:ligand-binding sensor domain-containing protein/signal transduction histidine kinase